MTRLFVGNLPPKATEEQLANEFSAYGVVSSVDIKVKETANNLSSKFAFISIEIEDSLVQQCIREFKEMPFHGHYLTVSVAKESFLDKLKREREEAAKEEFAKKLPKKVEKQEESEEFIVRKNAFADEMKQQQNLPDDEDNFLVKKRGQGAKIVNGMLKIYGDPGFVRSEGENSTKKSAEKDPKALMSEKKRLESLERKKNAYREQKFAIKSALSNGQSAEKAKKIIFGDTETREKPMKLLDDDDDDDEVDFSVRQQFQGESGQKLLKLQSKFQDDKRFALSEDFREDDDEVAGKVVDEFEDEKKKQLEILEGVVGRPLAEKPKKTFQTMLRYDPTKKDHEKYVKKEEDLEHNKGKNVKKTEAPVQVSSEKFYKVNTTSIEQSLKNGGEGFSLLKMLGRDAEPVEEADEEDLYETTASSSNLPPGKRFKYDSSDDEKSAKKKKTPAKIPKDTSGSKTGGKKNKRGLFRESFFIQSGDARLEEGGSFFQSLATSAGESFPEKRQQLKQIVSRKIRKNKLKGIANFVRKKDFKGKAKKIK
ncbi:probable RNA-binding protein CG14230 [Lutzomyia longipalpis]|uniref:probable RNA-binding protein CG14230 n=1 Tax=Lutzomyia longipalpis TaxID=7200 RepID=UPI00248401FD|nr:probable RNA-binding protein CG14230 [Lutzomyia longipalpis]